MSANYISMVSGMKDVTFLEVMKASPRKIRETLFGRLGIKAKKKFGLKVHGKLEERTIKLHERLKEAKSKQENELCAELLRNWLYTKREMLSDTLDFLEVKHDNGLVEEEPDFFKDLEEERVVSLVKHMTTEKEYDADTLHVYLSFVETPFLENAF